MSWEELEEKRWKKKTNKEKLAFYLVALGFIAIFPILILAKIVERFVLDQK